jgi:two-component system, NtrC family, response regulator AtoC
VLPQRTELSWPGSSEELRPEELIFGKSPLMQAIRKELDQTAPTDLPVLIEGESGCGKELLGRLVHQKSSRCENRLVKVQCPVLQYGMSGATLFGDDHEALTRAWMLTSGQAEAADSGTLLLDEISELERPLQTMLLGLLQDETPRRAWSKRLDVRLISLTHRNLYEQVESGAFRKDLFYRMNLIHIHVPPLRSRIDDIPELVDYMLAIYHRKFNVPTRPFPSNLIRLFQSYHWPGNIRQLETLVKRYVIMGSEELITTELVDQAQPRLELRVSPSSLVPLRS